MPEQQKTLPTAAEANDALIRQLCEYLGCEHDMDDLIESVEELHGIHKQYVEAMTEIASLTAMVATYDEEVTRLKKERDLAEAREDNARTKRRAVLMLLSAVHTAAGDPERKLEPSELVDRIRTQHLAKGFGNG